MATMTTTPIGDGGADLAAQWARVRGRLHHEVGEVEYRTWLRQMTLAGIDGDEARSSCRPASCATGCAAITATG